MRFHTKLGLMLVLSTPLLATADKLDSTKSKASYAFGIDIVNNLKQQGITLDVDALTSGIKDAYAQNEPRISKADMVKAKTEYQNELRKKIMAEQNKIAEENKKAGDAFLAANKTKPGIVTTDSGLQYKIITEGTGKSPSLNDTVVTHYHGTLIDGRVFDSSVNRKQPATFPVKGVIKGWTEALQLMKVGAKWQLFIPAELAYGKSKRSELIQPNSTLVFDIELLEIK